ncbi:MAG: energy transducer TonB [Pseudomonadota bacterium]|nr:energy transducer TonB [Pseudomonadota bacterium]
MSADRLLFTGLPAILTLLLHGGVVLVLVVRSTHPELVVAAAPATQPIQAALVSANDLKPKPKPKRQPNPKPELKPKSEPKPAPDPKPTPEPEPAPAKAPEPQQDSAPSLNAEQLAALTRDELGALMDTDLEAMGTAEPTLRDVVAATIRATVINRWTRPPSARNGMVAVLSIQLVPTGEVVGVSVLQSSGNNAFDRSAMNAVERSARFPDVAKLENAVFEDNFRRFQLIFKPEDLRY